MKTINVLHQQFAEYFGSEKIKPYAYLLSKKLKEGHICLPFDELAEDSLLLPDGAGFLPGKTIIAKGKS